MLSWNTDRGSHFEQIVSSLRRLEPDVLLLQEVDSGTGRVGGRDVAHDLAKELGLSEMYGVEFEELGQEKERHAYTGQATLSRLSVRASRVLRFRNQSGFWKPHS